MASRSTIRASVGVSTFPRDATTAEDLLRHADAAMYLAKGGGKDSFHVYRSRAKRTGARPAEGFDPRGAIAELDRILAERDLTAAFQPIVQIVSGDIVAYEALARGPEGSPLQRPDRLFATAAAAGRVEELDWLCRAVAVKAALDARLGRSATLFLNCEPERDRAPCPQSASSDLGARRTRARPRAGDHRARRDRSPGRPGRRHR